MLTFGRSFKILAECLLRRKMVPFMPMTANPEGTQVPATRLRTHIAIDPATEPLKKPPTSGFNHIARNTQATKAIALQRAIRKGLSASTILAPPSNFIRRFSLISSGFQHEGGGGLGAGLALIKLLFYSGISKTFGNKAGAKCGQD